jgi:hypothetical protein
VISGLWPDCPRLQRIATCHQPPAIHDCLPVGVRLPSRTRRSAGFPRKWNSPTRHQPLATRHFFHRRSLPVFFADFLATLLAGLFLAGAFFAVTFF